MEPIQSIGKPLTGNEERDCIHIAILPVIAAENLHRGEEIGLIYGTKDQVKSKQRAYDLNPIGIADPYFEEYTIEKGQRFWCFLFPGTVTGLRHHWTHPEVDQQSVEFLSESEKWLREFADRWNFDYDDMISESHYEEGYITARGIDLHNRNQLASGDEDKFWDHIEVLTGFRATTNHKENFSWSCSC